MFGKKRVKEGDAGRGLRQVDPKEADLNRKLIAWAFMLTGVISLGLWWRGKDRSQEGTAAGWWEGWIKPVEISFDVERRPTSPVSERTTLGAREELVKEMKERVATASGRYAVYVYELEKGEGWGFYEREMMPGASVLKLPVLVAAVRKVEKGEWKLEQEFELLEVDRSPGSGPLQFKPAGTKVMVGEMLTYLGKNSDNTAWLMVNRLVGSRAIEDVMLGAGMAASEYKAGSGTVTAVDVGKLLVKIYDQEVVGERGKGLIWEYLTGSIYEDRIPVGISDKEVRVVHKVGTLEDVWSDVGVVECTGQKIECKVEPFVLVILNRGVIRAEATGLVPWLAEKVWEYEKYRVGW